MSDQEVEFGTCKICGGTTYNVNGGSFLCKCCNCPAWYTPQEFFIAVRYKGEEGFLRRDKIPNPLPDGLEIIDAEVIGE